MLSWFKRKLKEMIKESLRELKEEETDPLESSEGMYDPEPEFEATEEQLEDTIEEDEGFEDWEDEDEDWEEENSEEEEVITLVGGESPWRSAHLCNNTLTVVLNDGKSTTLVNNESNSEMYLKVKGAKTIEEIKFIMVPNYSQEKLKEEIKEKEDRKEKIEAKKVESSFQILLDTGDFEEDFGSIYAKEVKRSLPKLLISKFSEVVSTSGKESIEYTSLLRFWYWCCLNPRAEVADMLYEFLEKNCLRLNKQGFFYALRNVVTVKGVDTTLVDFVSNSYNKIKGVWKKKPDAYEVFKSKEDKYLFYKPKSKDDYSMTVDNTYIGNLGELYRNIANLTENRFTDDYTKTFDIRIGKRVWMEPSKCNWSTKDCGHAGLHFTLDEINQVGCGDVSILIIINPMKVVAIGSQKGRCWEYFPIMTVPKNEVTKLLRDKDFDTLQLDEVYAEGEIEGLEEKVKTNFSVEKQKYSFNLPKITNDEIGKVVAVLNKIKGEIKGKVVEVKE